MQSKHRRALCRSLLSYYAVVMMLWGGCRPGCAQAAAPAAKYNLSVSVNEVSLTFHATDARGLAVNDLKLDELTLLDNGKPPAKIIAFRPPQASAVRGGILMDTSHSVTGNDQGDRLPGNRAVAVRSIATFLKQHSDQAFVMSFDRVARLTTPWTNDPGELARGIGNVQATEGVTAIFDTLYKACAYQFGGLPPRSSTIPQGSAEPGSTNFILLFSDGDDNASTVSLAQAVDACQHANTAIYVFRADAEEDLSSEGPGILNQLAGETGGRVFHDDDSEAQIRSDLDGIGQDLRNQYLLIYRPGELKRDASFHIIQLKAPERVDAIQIRSGYYAPAH